MSYLFEGTPVPELNTEQRNQFYAVIKGWAASLKQQYGLKARLDTSERVEFTHNYTSNSILVDLSRDTVIYVKPYKEDPDVLVFRYRGSGGLYISFNFEDPHTYVENFNRVLPSIEIPENTGTVATSLPNTINTSGGVEGGGTLTTSLPFPNLPPLPSSPPVNPTTTTIINGGVVGGTVKQKEVIKKESIIGPDKENSVGMRVQSVSTGYKFDFYLAPAMQSNFRMPGGRDVPNALPGGLNIRVRPNISKMKIPGSKPVYQNLGIDSVVVTVVGAFTGGNLTGTFFKENTSRIDDTEPGASLDTYRDYNEFISLIDLGEELDVEINLNQNMYDNINTLNQDLGLQPVSAQLPRERFESAARNMFYGNSEANKRATTFLRLQNGNPQFRCFLRDMQYSFVRDNLSYYIMQFEVTDFSGDGSSQNCVDYKPARLFNFEERTAPTDTQGNVVTQQLVNINKTGVVKSVADRDAIFNRLSQKDQDVLTKFFALDFTPDKNSLDWSFVSIGVDKYELVFLGKKDAFYDSWLRTVYGLFIDGNLSNRRLFTDADTTSTFMNFSYVFDPASIFTADSLDKYKTDAQISKSQVFDKLSKEQQAIVLKFEQLDGVQSWEFVKVSNRFTYYISYVGTKEYVYESGGANRIVVRTNSRTLSDPKSFVLTKTQRLFPNDILYFFNNAIP